MANTHVPKICIPKRQHLGRWVLVALLSVGWQGCDRAASEFAAETEVELRASASDTSSRAPTAEPPISLPRDIAQVEPVMRRLIEQQVAQIERATKGERTAGEPARAHAELGLVYEANGLWPEARRAFDAAVQLDETNSAYRLHLAISCYESGDLAAAQTQLERLVERAPDLAPAYQRLGDVLLARGELSQAEAVLRKLVQLTPDSAEGHAALGDVLLRQGRLDDAARELKRALVLDRNYQVAAFLLGTVLQRQGHSENARRLLQMGQGGKVRYLQDDLAAQAEQYAVTLRVRHRRAIQQMASGETQAAVENLQAALVEDPDNVAMLNLLAGAMMRQSRTGDAFELLQRAKQIDDRKATTFINLASWYLNEEKLPEALHHAEAAVERANWVLAAHYVRIATLIQMKRGSDARRALIQALRLSPADPTLRRYAKQLGARWTDG